MCKNRLIFDVIQLCIWKFLAQVTTVCKKKSNARAWGRLKLPNKPPFSQEVLAVARFVARCPAECWESNTTWQELLCHHCGHLLTGCRVRATDRAAIVMVPMEASSAVKHVIGHLMFYTLKWPVRELFSCKAVWHEKWVVFTHFLKGPPQINKDWISVKISPNNAPRLGIMSCENEGMQRKASALFKISLVSFSRTPLTFGCYRRCIGGALLSTQHVH